MHLGPSYVTTACTRLVPSVARTILVPKSHFVLKCTWGLMALSPRYVTLPVQRLNNTFLAIIMEIKSWHTLSNLGEKVIWDPPPNVMLIRVMSEVLPEPSTLISWVGGRKDI